jgi:mRNA interferase MazF
MKRGDIVWADLGNHAGKHIQSGRRPCLIISTDKGNNGVYTVIPGTSQNNKTEIPVHIIVRPDEVGWAMTKKTVFMMEQITTIDSRQIILKIGHIENDSEIMRSVQDMLYRQLELPAGECGKEQ